MSDITPLVNLRNLTYLSLEKNYVTDISALGNLVNLQELWINQNPVVDFTPLKTLSIATLYADEICDFPVDFISTKQRIENRHFPSVFQAWDTVVGLDNLTWEQRNVLHDLHWNPTFNHAIYWDTTLTQSTYGLATNLGGTIWHARAIRQRRLDQNPNMIFLRDFVVHVNGNEFFPPNSDFWVRDAHGQIVKKPNGAGLIDFVKPEVQDLLIERLIGVAKCGLYDGIFIDGFGLHGIGFVGRHLNSSTDEDMIQAMFNILSKAREQIPEDFLIIVNTNELRPHIDYAEFINGIFMETGKDLSSGYSLARLRLIENSLSWAETNLRKPRINCLEGEGMSIEPPDGPNNLRWMRLFTTLSLTHSDGYVLYTTGFRDLGGPHHDHLWHAFWDADLGRPVGTKAQQYQNTDGLFIREFTNGWAVYNRSEKAQTITLPASATPVSDRGNNAASQTHLLPDLDGEMYLKIKNPADVNGDWEVNVLDLVQVANGLGTATPDPNGDGVVNILDLIFVAQQFSE